MSAPLWIIPARVKAGSYLPEGATEEEIEQAAQVAMRNVLRHAIDGGHEIIWPTAKVLVESEYDYEHDRNLTLVMAFAVCAEREVAGAGIPD